MRSQRTGTSKRLHPKNIWEIIESQGVAGNQTDKKTFKDFTVLIGILLCLFFPLLLQQFCDAPEEEFVCLFFHLVSHVFVVNAWIEGWIKWRQSVRTFGDLQSLPVS